MRSNIAMTARHRSKRAIAFGVCAALTLTLLSACAKPMPVRTARPTPPPSLEHRNDEFVVVTATAADTPSTLARRYLGDEAKAWVIEDFNEIKALKPGQEIVIPLSTPNPTGVYANGYQTVPILCYHRFGTESSKMVVTAETFAQQMAYLAQHGYRVIRLADLVAFLQGEAALPKRAVVITMDDGYKSAYQYAYPILSKYGFPATIFVYTDFVGARDALTWKEMRELIDSGIFDIQPHSKTHSNLGIEQPDEDNAAYQKRIQTETKVPLDEIAKNLDIPVRTFAYPYGDTSKDVIELLKQRRYEMAVTVQPGANAAFAYPYMLQRSMVFGDSDLDTFIKQLDTFKEADLL